MASVASQLIEKVTAHAQSDSLEDAGEICTDGTYFPNNLVCVYVYVYIHTYIYIQMAGNNLVPELSVQHTVQNTCSLNGHHYFTGPWQQLYSPFGFLRIVLCIDCS